MSVIELDYRVEGLEYLLNEDCVLERFYPLVPYKRQLVENLLRHGCRKKSACERLTDSELLQIGLPDEHFVRLFRIFLKLYDINASKLKLLNAASIPETQRASLAALFRLPGVQLTRAQLYRASGFASLQAIAATTPETLIEKTTETIRKNALPCKPPYMKEAKTHIAVAKAMCLQPD